ncbi:MAG: transglycosylase domain-containing protein [Candidatus Paceibacterota bacterium]
MPKSAQKFPFIIFVLSAVASVLIAIGDAVILVLLTTTSLIVSMVEFGFRTLGAFASYTTRRLSIVEDFFSSIVSDVTSKIALFKITFPTRKKRKKKVDATIYRYSSFSNRLKYFLIGVVATTFSVFLYQSYGFVYSLPNPRLIGSVNFPVSTQIYDRNDRLLYEVFRDQNRTPVALEELPVYVLNATIAIEDKDFRNHKGISPIGGVARAIKDMIITGRLQGGSTITQQLVKTSLLSPERTIERKFREAVLALWTERIFSKDEILEMYLNQVAYGGSAYGIEQAAQNYFGKSARELDLAQAAFLAGLPQAPTFYSPYRNPQLALQRRNDVLSQMVDQGYISDFEYQENVVKPLDVVSPNTFIRAPHFVFYVQSLLEEKFGIRKVEEGGLRVTTTLDLDVQERAEQVLDEELEAIRNLNVNNGGILVTHPRSGEVLAMVGSRNYFEDPSGAYNVTLAQRQPGSSIKPVLYSLALQRGFTAATIINDSPVVFQNQGSPAYRPVNYDGRFHGAIPLRYALANSYNVPAVKTLNRVGINEFINHARKLGITTWDTPERYGLSLALGGAEVKMVDMAVAFGSFANGGVKASLDPFIKVTDFRGDVLYKNGEQEHERVLPENVSFIINDILSDNFARRFAFGEKSKLVIPGHTVAVKTGTTNDLKDNWSIGYTPEYLVATWVGNNDNTPMSRVASGVTGASPIWHRVMRYLLDEYDKTQTKLLNIPSGFPQPADIVKKKCYFGRDEYFVPGTQQSATCRKNVFASPSVAPSPNP